MDLLRSLGELIPASPADPVPWDSLEPLFASTCFSQMRSTPQNPLYHGEGDVMAHTRLVCGALNRNPAFHALPAPRKTALFLAALLHDIGKVRTTRQEDGEWVSPWHAPTGARIVRQFLWEEAGLCGTPEALRLRETVCALVRYHMLPLHAADREDPARKLRSVAAVGELAPDFTLDLLCMLSQADTEGRIASDGGHSDTAVQLCRMLAEEAGCLTGPYPFPDAFTRRAYLSGRKIPPDQPFYDSAWGRIVLMSGLPGTGKDTWIRANLPGLPVVSLDGIRASLGVSPSGGSQSRVVRAAQEQARSCLREKRPFVWNATNLTPEIREKVVRLAESYGAGVRVVYLEAPRDVREARNAGRKGAVPASAVAEMLSKTVPPLPSEAETVEWLCV